MCPPITSHIPQPCEIPACPARLWTGVMSAPHDSRARICRQIGALHCLLLFLSSKSNREGTYYVFIGTFYLEKVKGISAQCCEEGEALPYIDAGLLPKKLGERKPEKSGLGHVQNWVYTPLIAWGGVFGPAMKNLSKIFAYSKNSLSLSLLKEMPPIKFALRWSESEFITNPFYAVMSLIEYHIIKILIPCRNLQLWPMLSFNLSVINEPNWTSENFHGHACFPVFKSLFWFFFAFSLSTQCSYTNHTMEKNKKKQPPTENKTQRWDFISCILLESHPVLLYNDYCP